jgi:geranylgeranyl pyrophosphate synthase
MILETALLAVELELENQCAQIAGPMLEVCRYAVQGGRRMRASLLLSAAKDIDDNAVRAATAIELLHSATLLQDDIFDAGVLRRGRTAAYVQFGRALTILASDWLLIRSLEMAADLHPHFFRCMARAGTVMAQAEAQELEPPALRSLEDARQYGFRIAEGKTAALFQAALCGAAMVQGLSVTDSESWEQIGLRMGLTYQILDDCTDVYGSESAAGKNVGADLARGCLTMPVLLAVSLLDQRGTHIPLAALQADQVRQPEMSLLQTTLHTAEVKCGLSELLGQRLASHRSDAKTAGLPMAAIDDCFDDMRSILSLLQPTEPVDTQEPCGPLSFPHARCFV